MRNEALNDKCTILINSCDAFSDVWDLFFTAFRVQWQECDMPVILSTESKKYDNAFGVKVCNFATKDGKDCWGKRLKHALKQINTPYVITILDDFVLKEKFTGQGTIRDCIKWMDENDEIGVFYLCNHPNVIQKKTDYPDFGLMPQKCDYKLTTSVGIWRKDYLNKCIKGIETPWEWEVCSTRRAWRFKEKMYALLENAPCPYNYQFGGVIWRGLWHPEAEILAKKYGIYIDFTIRGFMDEDDPYRRKNAYSIRKHFPRDILKPIFWKQSYERMVETIRKVLIII